MNEQPTIPVEEIKTSTPVEKQEDKLFTFKDIEGNEQFEVVDKIARLGDFLREKDPKIIGVSVVGSTVKGYALPENQEVSDVDVCIIVDDPSISGLEISPACLKAHNEYIPQFSQKNNIKIQVIKLAGVNVSHLDPETIYKNPISIRELIFPIFGDTTRIQECVNDIRQKLDSLQLNEVQKKLWINHFSKKAIEYESRFLDKPAERKGISHEEKQDYIDKRKELYKNRIKKLFID